MLAAYLPRFNARFAVPAAVPTPVWRPLAPPADPWQICCLRYVRVVGRDDTVRLGEHRLQLLPVRGHGTYARCRVEVREHLDGSLSVWHHGQPIATQPAPSEAPQLRVRSGEGRRQRSRRVAPASGTALHPTRGESPLAQRLQDKGVTFSQLTCGDKITARQQTHFSIQSGAGRL